MTNDDRLRMLQDAVARYGSQAKVGRLLGYSSTTVSQVLNGTYGGQLDGFLTRVEETFSPSEVDCPILGTITLPVCVAERRQPFCTANPHRVRMYQACRKCGWNTDPREE